jgi:hypothetical protein
MQVTPTSLDLHYQSHRPGLGALTIGIIKGVATALFNIEVGAAAGIFAALRATQLRPAMWTLPQARGLWRAELARTAGAYSWRAEAMCRAGAQRRCAELARRGDVQRWRVQLMCRAGAQRRCAELARRGDVQSWRAELARRGGVQS